MAFVVFILLLLVGFSRAFKGPSQCSNRSQLPVGFTRAFKHPSRDSSRSRFFSASRETRVTAQEVKGDNDTNEILIEIKADLKEIKEIKAEFKDIKYQLFLIIMILSFFSKPGIDAFVQLVTNVPK